MLKKVFQIMKKIILSAVLLYAYNKLAISFNAIIPINVVTVAFVLVLGIPAIVGLVLFNLLFF